MPRDFLPWRDADLVPFTANFGAKIAADPGAYNITAERAAAYLVLQEDFAAAYQRAVEPGTATGPARRARQTARTLLENETRAIAGMIRNMQSVTPEMRVELGMNTRNGGGRSPRIQPPAAPPIVRVVAVMGRTVKIRLVNSESPTRRGKPRGVGYAMLWKYVGETPPADPNEWQRARTTSVTMVDISFDDPALDPGTKVWVTARWENPRCEPGPACAPVYAYLSGGVMMAA